MDVQFPYRGQSRHKKPQTSRGFLTARRIAVVFSALVLLYIVFSASLALYAQRNNRPKETPKEKPIVEITPSRASPAQTSDDEAFRKNREEEEAKRKADEQMRRQIDSEINDIISKSNHWKALKNWTLSLELLENGLQKYPWSDKICTYIGGWHYDQGNWTGAEIWYRKAHSLNMEEVIYVMNVALCLVNQHREHEAIEWYQLAYSMKPSVGQLLALMNLQWKFNNWSHYEENIERIIYETREEYKQGRSVSINSFVALHFPFNLYDIQKIAESSSKQTADSIRHFRLPPFEHDPVKRRSGGRRIRVGYVSYDLRQHAVGIQIQSIFGFHNRSNFEVFAYNVNDGQKDSYVGPVNDKIRNEVEHYVDIGSAPLPEFAQRIFDDKIDILIDVGLFTAYARTDVFVPRPAPIQVAWLGLATTTGGPWMDYIVGDPVVTPHYYAKYYTEKLAVLPHSYHVVDHKQGYGVYAEPNRRAHGLPDNKFIFCNHANNIRLNPEIFTHWMNIVKKSPNSVMLLKHFNDEATKNLKIEAERRGMIVTDDMDKSQVLFQHGIGGGEHIAYKSMCDLYLDCHYYNGHSTTADMLWAGVPLVTYPGETMASRAAASFVTSTGLPTERMIANSWEDYEEKAIDMAKNANTTTKQIRQQLRAKRLTMPFFDTQRWVRNFERAMEQMFARYIAGKSPEHVYVIDNDP